VACFGCGKSGTEEEGAASIRGTWDVIGSSLSSSATASFSVTLEPNLFAVTAEGDVLRATLAASDADIEFNYGSRDDQMHAVRLPSTGANLGAVPVNFSGDWTFENTPDNGAQCSWSLSTDSVSGNCVDVQFAPRWAPDPDTGSMTGSRTRAAASIFGDLGGEWQLSFSEGASLTATFEGNTMTLNAVGQWSDDHVRSFSLTFDGDTAYGSGNDGLEFSAQRR
jgi:hypothetical protein